MQKHITIELRESIPSWIFRPLPDGRSLTPHQRLICCVIWANAEVSGNAILTSEELASQTGLRPGQVTHELRRMKDIVFHDTHGCPGLEIFSLVPIFPPPEPEPAQRPEPQSHIDPHMPHEGF
jgi:hypothetical protein